MGEFTMPSLGADMDEGTLVEWLTAEGAEVARGDVVAVVETAKSTIEVECFESGTVTELLVEPGATVPVGTPLAVISPTAPVPPPAARGAVPAEEGTATPLVRHQAAEEGVDLKALQGSGRGGRITRSDVSRAAHPGPSRIKASPLARRLADSLGVDLATVRGSGRNGAVKADDVRAAAASGTGTGTGHAAVVTEAAVAAGPRRTATPTPPDSGKASSAGDRAAIARLMSRAKREIPHYYLSTTVDLAAALEWMRRQNSTRPVGERLVPAALLLKAVALAAREVPELNGHWTDGRFVAAAGVRLGTAVSLRGGGLVAPALADADRMPLTDVMAALKDLVSRARHGRLRASETADPTLTVTNLGDQGVESVFGVIYPPQVAMVGLGRVTERPVAVAGMIALHPTVTATLSADHRASDGATGARFLTALDRLLQHPEDL
ncbi:dihydrolipoamide acetyltransferase family protein [Streptomyces sp. NPDC060232]|uniref:dihydrolipoamide acetyltransferase family protein n=1 Tax=Streptomyces sp. NPDC060232 TaxID=3347079 RepID=UPI003659C808